MGGEIVQSTYGSKFPVGEDVNYLTAKYEPLPVVNLGVISFQSWRLSALSLRYSGSRSSSNNIPSLAVMVFLDDLDFDH